MSEENILMPVIFDIKNCAQNVEPLAVSEEDIIKIPYRGDNRKLIITIAADGDLTVSMLGYRGHPNKELTCESGKIAVLRAFESAWYKHEDGCLHLQLAPSSGATASVIATEEV